MLQILARLEHKIGDRIYHLTCDSQAPLSEIKDSLIQFMSHVATVEKTVKEQMDAKAQADAQTAPAVVPSEVISDPASVTM